MSPAKIVRTRRPSVPGAKRFPRSQTSIAGNMNAAMIAMDAIPPTTTAAAVTIASTAVPAMNSDNDIFAAPSP